MTKCKYILLLAAILLQPSACLFAQTTAGNPVIYSLTEQDGLSDNAVTCFYQDSKGFMWIGTADGLNRYDGSSFRTYKSKTHTPGELAGNYIHAITEDAGHYIWIGTFGGLSKYDPVADTFHSWKVNNENDISVLTDVLIDKAGNIWAASFDGLLCFNTGRQQFSVYTNNAVPAGILKGRNNRINKILIDREQRFWLCTFNGLWRFYPENGRFEQYISGKDLPSGEPFINNMLEDHAGRLWLACYGDGLELFDPVKKTVQDYFGKAASIGPVNAISESKDIQGNYVLNNGRVELDPVKKTFRYLYSLPGNALTLNKTYTSRDNLLWLATNKGIKIIDPAKQFFHNYYLSATDITPQTVSILQKDNSFYVGGAGNNFLKLYDSAFRLIKAFPSNASALLNIRRENDHELWLCTEHGLILFNEKTGSRQFYHAIPGDTSAPEKDFMSNIFIDSKNNHWLFPWRSGIWQIDKTTSRFKRMLTGFITENNEFKKLLVNAAAEDDNGNIWFGDLDEGLIRYDYQAQAFSKPKEKELGSRFPLANVEFEKPWVWGVTSGMVFRVHTTSMKLEQWKIPDEFNVDVYSFCSDQYGHLWILTRKGLLYFDKGTHTFKRYTANDGLPDNVLSGTIWQLGNGKILYAGNNYITVFDPKEVTRSGVVPPVVLTAVFSQNRQLSIQTEDNGEKLADLDYTYNNFTFNWAIQNYSNPLQNQYYCKLEGVDNDWKYAGTRGEAQYASLSPGNYTFRMRGATSDGVMNSKGDYVVIIIHPPFWRSWWFVTLAILGIAVIIYTVYRYRLNEALRLEKLRSKISTDLHDDIGSTLSSISILSDMALREKNQDTSSGMMQEIKDNSVSLMEKMDDIVWSINPKNDSLENLLLRIKRFASRLFEAKGIDYDIIIQDNIHHLKLPMANRQHIYLVMKEAINNLVKYSQCSKATIQVTYTLHNLRVVIKDNGKGFDTNQSFNGNGLLSMKNRATVMGADLDIGSAVGKGTTIDLSVKL